MAMISAGWIMGGGLGIPYRRDNNAPPLPIEYGQVIRETVGDLGCEIEIEPGRNISGNAGILLSPRSSI
jgi:diaminopimelate decarboxylase